LARPENAGKTCTVEIDLHPQRVAKQALTSILAASQPGLTIRYPLLRELLTAKEQARPIHPIRLWLYLRANSGMRRTGLGVALNVSPPAGQLLAELSSWPLGWIVSFGSLPIPGAIDVSTWAEIGFHERQQLQVHVPCQVAHGPYPGAFGPIGS
jgi:hypothetical protein